MSIESKLGGITRDVTGAIADAVSFNLASILKSEMGLRDDQIVRVTAIVRSTIESTGLNGVNQYVAAVRELQSESEPVKKGKFFG